LGLAHIANYDIEQSIKSGFPKIGDIVMYEPLSIAASVWLGSAALKECVKTGSAQSQAAGDVAEKIAVILNETEAFEVLHGPKSDAFAKLMAIATNCVQADWDGDGAQPINEMAVQNAEAFIRAIPDDMPMPEFAPEPDGYISLDWMDGQHSLFSLSVGADNRLAYAWLAGTNKGHAVARFDGITIPPMIKSGVESVIGNVNNAVRIA
jgi:hypothetical protein